MTLSARSRPRGRGAPAVPGRARFARAWPLRGWLAARWRELARGGAVPGTVRVQLAFEPGERVLSAGQHPDGGYALVLTHRALYHRALDADGWSRLGWELIASVRWDTAVGGLVIIGLDGVAPQRTVVPLQRRGGISELARERVTHTRLGRWVLPVAGDHHVLVEARRRPVTGELRWVVISGADDPGSGELSGHVEQAIARLAADLGVSQWSGAGSPPASLPVTGRHRSGGTEAAAG